MLSFPTGKVGCTSNVLQEVRGKTTGHLFQCKCSERHSSDPEAWVPEMRNMGQCTPFIKRKYPGI